MKIGVIREGKVPSDSRVPLTPIQCRQLIEKFGIKVVVQPSEVRCIKNEEYVKENITLQEDLRDCDILLGVKEVPKDQLIADKAYFFFSHTIKEQPYNRDLLKTILNKNIQLIDYEVLTNEARQRVIAFGVFAGMVGAHNAIWTYAQRTKAFEFPRMNDLFDYAAAKSVYNQTNIPKVKVVVTGKGRVASGSAKVLRDMGIVEVSPEQFLNEAFEHAVYTQLDCDDYAIRKDGSDFDLSHFFANPGLYKSIFQPYTEKADIMINGIYWDNDAPAFFTVEDMKREDFKIRIIADVTCDIAPVSSIPATLFASTIADPIFGYDPKKNEAVAPHGNDIIDMMTIDNLPNELPRDASQSFGEQFLEYIAPELANMESSGIIERGTITKDGKLGPHFGYLENYAFGS